VPRDFSAVKKARQKFHGIFLHVEHDLHYWLGFTAHGVLKAAKILVFGLLALGLLIMGCVAAQSLWSVTHDRHDQPFSGYYHGSVHARFSGVNDDVFSFHFQGQSKPRWQWTYSTNFVYHSLQFGWSASDSQAKPSEGSGMLTLPSLAYESSRGTGILTRAVLSEWLLVTTNRTPEAERSVDAVFGFIQDAGRGTLPAPNHHHHYEQPVQGQIMHFQPGLGVGGLVYIWIAVWLLGVVLFGRRFWE